MRTSILVFSLLLAATHAVAHSDKPASAPHAGKETSFGRPGDASKVTRTVEIDMSDKMRFTPDRLTVNQGDTVKFVATNSGKQKHEMVLGSMERLRKKAKASGDTPGTEQDEPYEIDVEPGRKAEMVWQFTKPGDFAFGCLLPGHFEAGMVGRIKVVKASTR